MKVTRYIITEGENLKTIPPHPFLIKFFAQINDDHFFYFIIELVEG